MGALDKSFFVFPSFLFFLPTHFHLDALQYEMAYTVVYQIIKTQLERVTIKEPTEAIH